MSNPTAADLIAAGRMAVYQRMPYLSHALFALRPVAAPGLGTLAVDAGWRLYYDPETVLEWHQDMLKQAASNGGKKQHDGIAAVIFHELGHVLRQHHKRAGDRDKQVANIAMDMEINDDLKEANWRLPCKGVMPKDCGQKDGLTFEDYYPHIKVKKITITINMPGAGGKCGGCAGNPTDWEKNNEAKSEGASGGQGAGVGSAAGEGSPAALDSLDEEIILRRVACDIEKHVKSKGKGSVPAGLQAWSALKLQPPKVDWRKRLAALTRGALNACAGATDFTWRQLGRRGLHSAGRTGFPLTPKLFAPTPCVAVVLDTSGSMGGGEDSPMMEALTEVVGIAKAAGAGVRTYACDAAVHASAMVASIRDLDRVNKGGGGTSMVAGIEAAVKNRPFPDLIVVLTDGYTDIPYKAPKTRLLWVIVGGNKDFTAPGQVVIVE